MVIVIQQVFRTKSGSGPLGFYNRFNVSDKNKIEDFYVEKEMIFIC